jgi:hypothetical protein
VDVAAILTGLFAILTGTGGVILVVREFRRRDRRECQRDVDELVRDLHLLRGDFAEFRRWAFLMQERAVDAGADVSSPPEPRPLAPTDHEGLRVVRRTLRHRGGADDGDGGTGDR